MAGLTEAPVDYQISIHAAQEGCDAKFYLKQITCLHFNPRSPRGLRRGAGAYTTSSNTFQSTQPKRAATRGLKYLAGALNISIHAAQEGCDFDPYQSRSVAHVISIHAAQEGCDLNNGDIRQAEMISIHAAQEGCDCQFCKNGR